MIEKVNPSHPDKVADRIAGAIVDLAYKKETDPKIAVEILIGHGHFNAVIETSTELKEKEIAAIADRIAGKQDRYNIVIKEQDRELAKNQKGRIRCGDNGIFSGYPTTTEEYQASAIARSIYSAFPTDGKLILSTYKNKKLIICQSHADDELKIKTIAADCLGDRIQPLDITINPLGFWTGGLDVDTGATNRKLGSDMARAVTGGGLHGKDLSKADVTLNIYAHLKAQKERVGVNLSCAIGDDTVDGLPYAAIVEIARRYIEDKGGFEKFAEWGLF